MPDFTYTNVDAIDCSVEPDLTRLKHKSVIVTGGSSGLGAAYVNAFINAGAFVTNADIQSSHEHDNDASYQYVHCDVTSWRDQLNAFKAAIEKSPEKSLDIVVANAGITGPDPVHKLEESDEPDQPDLKILNINLVGVVYTAKLAMHYFNKQEPSRDRSLILKSSLAGYLDLPGSTQYNVSKYGVRGLMCNLRRTGRMRVNLLAPWYIRTPIMSDTVANAIDATLNQVGSSWAKVDDAVKACLRCATDEKVNGRALAIIPREVDKNGYMDLAYDDYLDRPDIGHFQFSIGGHRATVPPNQQ